MLREKILGKRAGILTYGMTPPKKDHPPEKIIEITSRQIERIKNIDIDGLIIYDIQDEKERTEEERPFPFLETVDSVIYAKEYLKELDIPKIIYRCVGKYTKEQLVEWISSDPAQNKYSVFVGASSKNQEIQLSLKDAYAQSKNLNPNFLLGGVTIPERHRTKNDEHLRVLSKMNNGCNFFVSQAVYNIEASKNFLSDYYYYCKKNECEMVPILFTLTPCGSIKTLQFMKWLGIDVPRWLENELTNSEDFLNQSISCLKVIFEELLRFSKEKGIPIGCNVESVSVRKVEIEASIVLAEDIKKMMQKVLG